MEIKEMIKEVHDINVSKGFWDNKETKNVGEMLMLVTSELAEALEADRDGKKANKEQFVKDKNTAATVEPHLSLSIKYSFEKNIKNSFEDEIADAVIRLFDICGGLNIDLEWHIRQKVDYNKKRPHKHGRAY